MFWVLALCGIAAYFGFAVLVGKMLAVNSDENPPARWHAGHDAERVNGEADPAVAHLAHRQA